MEDVKAFKDFESSERAKKIGQIDQRWEMLEIGRSFSIEQHEMAISNLRNKAWYMGKKLNKRFTVIDHKEKGYEVCRKA